jgi:hypothetical protein
MLRYPPPAFIDSSLPGLTRQSMRRASTHSGKTFGRRLVGMDARVKPAHDEAKEFDPTGQRVSR